MRIVYAALVALSVTAPQFIVRVPVAAVGVALSCADVSTRCVPSEYATIVAAENASSAGDIVWVSAGTYPAVSATTHNGTSGSPITVLANGAVNVCSLAFSGNSYLSIVGVTVDGNASGCSNAVTLVSFAGVNTGLEFWNDTVANTTGQGYLIDHAGNGAVCNACIWLGGSIHDIGTVSSTALHLAGNDDFVGYLNITVVCYIGIGPAGNRQRFVNNNFSGMIQSGSTVHPDFFYIAGNDTLGWSNALWESTFGIGTVTSADNKVYHAQNQVATDWNDDVVRLNVAYHMGSASSHSLYTTSTGNIIRWRQYNNDHLVGDRAVSGPDFVGCGGGNNFSATITAYVYNSLYDQCWADSNSSGISPLDAVFSFTAFDYNLAFSALGTMALSAGWNSQAHKQNNVDPKLTDVSGMDFTLQSTSGARGVGGPLTTAVGAGVSSTTLTVATNTGSFFVGSNAANLTQYGGVLAPGDFITVGSTTVQVSSVSGDVVTLASAISWNNADPVYFGSSSTIDIGAYPYKAGGYTLTATKAQVGSTVTITPNDASLARFAVVYENLIPKCIAAASNAWACTVGTGVITAAIYPRYASQTQSVAIP